MTARGWLLIDIWAALAFFSIIFYAFTGMVFWAPTQPFDQVRPMALALLHICPIFAAVMHRIIL